MLVDTNVLSELTRPGPDANVAAWAARQARFDLSGSSLEEVFYGLGVCKNARLWDWFERFVATHCDVLPVSPRIARRCAGLRAELSKKGRVRTRADLLIAATAANTTWSWSRATSVTSPAAASGC